MADKNKEKEGYYFKIIPKVEFPKFIERLKEALEKDDNKKGDKKTFEFEIRGTREELNGSALEIYSFDESKYEKFIDVDQDYIKNALYCISLNLSAKDESGVEKLEKLFQQFKLLFQNIPALKDKSEFFFRSKGREVSVDLVIKEGKLIQALLDLGIDFAEYHRFNLEFLIGLKVSEFFNEWEDPALNLIKILSIIFSIQSETENCRYLLIALSDALKEVKIDAEKIQKKFDKFVNFLRFLNSFEGNKIKLEYDAKILAGESAKEAERMYGGSEKLKTKISNTQQMIKGLLQNLIVPMINNFGMKEHVEAAELDKISISLTVPKYKNGLALSLKLPGLSKILDELLDN